MPNKVPFNWGKWAPWIALGVVVIVFIIYILYSRSVFKDSKTTAGPDGIPASCTTSQVTFKNPDAKLWRTVGPGNYTIDKNDYEMKVWPPLTVEARGPNPKDYQKTVYPVEGIEPGTCPNYSNLVLDKDKNYTTVQLTKPTAPQPSAKP
jgi:hypothetical protein